jgi:hypothetical protein
MHRMRIEAMSTVGMAMMGRPNGDLRGLEHHYRSMVVMSHQQQEEEEQGITKDPHEYRHYDWRQQVEEYRNAVLDEHVKQWATTDRINPERLARIS